MGIPMSLGMMAPPNPTCLELEEDDDAVEILRKGINDISNMLVEDHLQQEVALKNKLALKENLSLTGHVPKEGVLEYLTSSGEITDGPHLSKTKSVEQVSVRNHVSVCLV